MYKYLKIWYNIDRGVKDDRFIKSTEKNISE